MCIRDSGRIERVALPAAKAWRDLPALGAVPGEMGGSGPEVQSTRSGYVRHVDIAALQAVAEAAGLQVQILRMPGKYVHRGEGLLRLSADADQIVMDQLQAGFSLGNARSFDQDLGYGLTVLSEVASKALSPAINDPGTAIEVLRAGTRVLQVLHEPSQADSPSRHDRVFAPPLDLGALYATFFAPIARDGAGLLEVQETLQDCLAALARSGDAEAALRQADRAFARAEQTLDEDWERRLLAAARD